MEIGILDCRVAMYDFFPFNLFYSSVRCVFALPVIGMDCSRSGFCMFFFMINKDDILYSSPIFAFELAFMQ